MTHLFSQGFAQRNILVVVVYKNKLKWNSNMKDANIEDLKNWGVTIDDKLANMTLDIRVQPGGLSDPRIQNLRDYLKDKNVQLTIKEFK